MARRLLCTLLVAATVLGPGLVAPGPASAEEPAEVRVGENVRLGSDAGPVRGRGAPGLAVDPADPDHLVEVDIDYLSGNCEFRVSFDGGLTWDGGVLPVPEGFEERGTCTPIANYGRARRYDQTVEFGSGGNVYTVFAPHRPGEDDSIVVAKSTDGGVSWGTTVALPGSAYIGTGATAEVYWRRPKLTVEADPAGDHVHVSAWRCPPVLCYSQIVVATSTDGAASFSEPVVVNAPGQFAYDSSPPLVDSEGTIHVVYRRAVSFFFRDSLHVASSDDGGASWTQQTVRELFGQGAFLNPKIVEDPLRGTLYVGYRDAGASPRAIVVQRSEDGGATWSEPVRVDDASGGVDRQAGTVWLTATDDGDLHVTWWDRRHSTAEGTFEDVYYARSADGGRTFGPNHRITDRTGNRDLGFKRNVENFSPVTVPVDGGLLAAWSDSREGSADDGNQDIYLAELDLAPTGTAPVETISEASAAELSARLSAFAYPGGNENVGASKEAVTRVVVVNAGDAAGTLAAGVLARRHLGPVLLSAAEGLPGPVAAEVGRLQPAGAYLVGGEDALSAGVVDDLVDAGVPSEEIVRIAEGTPAATAAAIARSLDERGEAERALGSPAFPAAVVVNPETPDAAAASGLAASLRFPVLFVDRDAIPTATRDALDALDVPETLVVGGSAAVGEDVVAELPDPTRLGGEDAYATSEAVVEASVGRGLPTNVVYVADGAGAMEGALLGHAVARRGGLLLLAPGADTAHAKDVLEGLGLGSGTDRLLTVDVS